jgi:GTP-binding protein EngB required for normal cell division
MTGGMNDEFSAQLSAVSNVVAEFALGSLVPVIDACKELSSSSTLGIAVLGQFKSGKSSFLNALLGENLLPVGALPVTAVVTRVSAGAENIVQVSHIDGSVERIPCDQLADYVTEAGNPENTRQVAVVDVFTPAMSPYPGIQFVDTPGLGSVFTHNTQTTHNWMPKIAAAIVAISAERPLSQEDAELIEAARQTAPRVVLLLTKIDLLAASERQQVIAFLKRGLVKQMGIELEVLPFSNREQVHQWLTRLKGILIAPIMRNMSQEREAVLRLKLRGLTKSCQDYLAVGMKAAESTRAERQLIRAAVMDEQLSVEVLQDELRSAEEKVIAATRPAFHEFLFERSLGARGGDSAHEGGAIQRG